MPTEVGAVYQAIPYLPLFYRAEHRRNARIVIQGLLSGLARKTAEPIARQQGVPRKRIQAFVGWGKWDDQAVMRELRRHVVEVMVVPAQEMGPESGSRGRGPRAGGDEVPRALGNGFENGPVSWASHSASMGDGRR